MEKIASAILEGLREEADDKKLVYVHEVPALQEVLQAVYYQAYVDGGVSIMNKYLDSQIETFVDAKGLPRKTRRIIKRNAVK